MDEILNKGQIGLFEEVNNEKEPQNNATNQAPLAFRMRPTDFNDFEGQDHLFTQYPFLANGNFPSLVLYGPPGCGKTTLAKILAKNSNKEFCQFNAVLGGVADLKKIIKNAKEMKKAYGQEYIIFIDEIHRFNKSQQDALLPHIESGEFTLIGATTEHPKQCLNKAIISRVKLIPLRALDSKNLVNILKRANDKISDEIINYISDYSNGDARSALNLLEDISQREQSDIDTLKEVIKSQSRSYDKNSNRHYDVISAFIKSLRGSDPDAALLWLAVMLDGGEDPVFIARRLVILASEDIGNADPQALTLASSTLNIVQQIGMPEARITLAQATTYLASTAKSNASYLGINEALDYVQNQPTIEVPDHLKNFPPKNAKKYLYPHSYKDHWISQNYTNEKSLPQFYRPTNQGIEEKIKNRLDSLK